MGVFQAFSRLRGRKLMVVLVAVFIAAAMVTLVLSVISVHRVVVAQQAQLQTLSSLVETDIRHREVRQNRWFS